MYQRLSRIGLQGLQQAQSKGFRFFSNESDIFSQGTTPKCLLYLVLRYGCHPVSQGTMIWGRCSVIWR